MSESKKKTIQAVSLEEAVARAARELGCDQHDVHYRLIDEGRRGVMGIGQRDVRIEIDLGERAARQPAEEPAAEPAAEPASEPARRERRAAADRVKRPAPPTEVEPEAENDDDRRGNLKRDVAVRDDRRGNRRGRDDDRDDSGGGRRRRGRRGGRGGRRRRDRGSGERRGEAPRGERRPERSAPREDSGPPMDISAEALERFVGTVQKMIDLMGLELTARAEPTSSGVRVDLDGADVGLVRDRETEFQFGLQFVLNRMSRRAFPDVGRIQVGRGPARNEARDQELIEEVREVASQVLRTGIPNTLHPMNPYERRLVHLTVREFDGLETESGGEGFLKPVTVRRT